MLKNNKPAPGVKKAIPKVGAKPGPGVKKPGAPAGAQVDTKIEPKDLEPKNIDTEISKQGATTGRVDVAGENTSAKPQETKAAIEVNSVDDEISIEASGDEPKGIRVNDQYIIQNLDVLNVVLQERYVAKPKEGEEDAPPRYLWKIVAYCANLESAWRTIVDRKLNVVPGLGLEAIVKEINELKVFKQKLIAECSGEEA